MTHRLKILTAVFVFLVALVVFSLYTEDTGEMTVRKDVALQDTSAVNKIVFVKPQEGEFTLTKLGDGAWQLNNQYEARDYLITLLLAGLNKLEVKREVSESKSTQIAKDLKVSGYLVKLYNNQGNLLEEFYVSPNENDPNTAYYLPDDSDVPYIVYVPGFEGSIANLFALGVNDWREKIFFTSTSRNLQEVSVQYPSFPDQNFSIAYQDGDFALQEDIANLDSTRLRAYLSTYKVLTIGNYLEGGKQALEEQFGGKQPLAILNVRNLDKQVELHIYERQGKLFGYFPEENEFVTLNNQLYSRLLVKKEFFKKQPEGATAPMARP